MVTISAFGLLRQALLVVVAAAFFSGLALPAGAAQCPTTGEAAPPKVHLTTAIAKPAYRNDRTRREITAASGNPLGTGGTANAGLTSTRTEFLVQPRVMWSRLPEGRGCVVVTEVEAEWRMTAVNVDIAAEYLPGSCQYRAVKDHEEQHVRLNRQAFQDRVADMQARLKVLAANSGAFITEGSPQDAAQGVADALRRGVQPVLETFHRESRRMNASIDTSESYASVAAKCTEW